MFAYVLIHHRQRLCQASVAERPIALPPANRERQLSRIGRYDFLFFPRLFLPFGNINLASWNRAASCKK
jgi:hypothetical protein